MGNRFRVVLNLLNFSIEGEENGSLSPEQRDFSAGLLLAERESVSLARELHDGPIQKFSAAGLMIDLAGEFLSRGDFGKAREELARTRSHIGDALEEFRSFLFQLNPTGLKDGFDVLGFRYSCRFWVQMVRQWVDRRRESGIRGAANGWLRFLYGVAMVLDVPLFWTRGHQMTVFCRRKGWREKHTRVLGSGTPVSDAVLFNPRVDGRHTTLEKFR